MKIVFTYNAKKNYFIARYNKEECIIPRNEMWYNACHTLIKLASLWDLNTVTVINAFIKYLMEANKGE